VRLNGARDAVPSFVLIRPEDIQVAGDGAAENVWEARVVDAAFLGAYQRCRLHLSGAELIAHFPRHAAAAPGVVIRIRVSAEHCVALA
jgi:ABC-type sugar transport system ATPase subunit